MTAIIRPGSTLGMLGGGQLGRMFTVAARTMGYEVVVLDPDSQSPAGALASEHVCADYVDERALDHLAATCVAVSTEFENVPAAALERLAQGCIVRPSGAAVAPVQNRISEKRLLDRHDIPTTPWAPVERERDLEEAEWMVGVPAILKSARGGYDGKGQALVDDRAKLADAFADLGRVPAILEHRVDLAREVSVIVCRAADGTVAAYPPAENVHRNGILHTSTVPAGIEPALAERAHRTALAVARALGYVGVLGVEMFVSKSGEVLVNEIAPRPHNSGHYTLDACATTQFEQQVRLLCGLPPGDTRLLSPVCMVNLLGDLWGEGEPAWDAVLTDANAYLHLYGKREARPGRKMGHLNVLGEQAAEALARAEAHHRTLTS